MNHPRQPVRKARPKRGDSGPACPARPGPISSPGDLRQSEEKLRLIFDNVHDIVYEMDANRTILSVNPAFERNLGWCAAEWIGKNAAELIHPEDLELADQRLQEFIQRRRPVEPLCLRILAKDGSYRTIEFIPAPLLLNEPEPRIFGIGRDITEKKQAEEENRRLASRLLQAQKMEAVGTLAGGIAHDFNNLLMGIQGYASLMAMELDALDPFYEHLKGIENCVQSAAELTRQLLGFAQRGKYEVKPTHLNDLIESTSRMFGRTRKQLSIEKKLPEGIWMVEVDQGQVSQVLMNLFINAWQAMAGGGYIYIETENAELGAEAAGDLECDPGRYVKISVTDTGVGMDEETRQRIFEPFFTTKAMGRGTGLGLASVYGIVRNHQGCIDVHSELGLGTTFNVYLPASQAETAQAPVPVQDPVKGQGRVLLIDDEELIIKVGEQLLDKLGYAVSTAKSGPEALAIFAKEKQRIDIVILDMIMPDMNGEAVYYQLKGLKPDVKILISSGYNIETTAEALADQDGTAFIQKPFNLADLSRKLKEVSESDPQKSG